MQLPIGLQVSYRVRGEPIVWKSPPFDLVDFDTDTPVACKELGSVPELLNIPSDAEVEFSLIDKTERILGDSNYRKRFHITCLPNRYDNKLSYLQDDGVFASGRETKHRFFSGVYRAGYLTLSIAVVRTQMEAVVSSDDDVEKVRIFQVAVTVCDSEGWGAMCDRMALEVASVNPGLTEVTDQKMVSPALLKPIWKDSCLGDTDGDYPMARLEELKQDVQDVLLGENALVRVLESNPFLGLEHEVREVPFKRIRNVTQNQIYQLQRRELDPDDVDAEFVPVSEACLGGGDFNTLEHRVIRTYIDDLRKDLQSLQENFRKEAALYEERREHAGDFYNRRIKCAKAAAGLAERLDNGIADAFLNPLSPWQRIRGGVQVLTVETGLCNFTSSATYCQIYWRMWRYYLRKHWHRMRDGNYFLPEYMIVDEPIFNRQQRKIDFLYESWVFVKLLKAFDQCGFQMSQAYEKVLRCVTDVFLGLEDNQPISASTESGTLKVEVAYGVSGRVVKPNRQAIRKTPDFMICFEDIRDGQRRRHVIILDAKCKNGLTKGDWNKRLGNCLVSLERNQDKPHQSWLVYLGQSESRQLKDVVSGIEFKREDSFEGKDSFLQDANAGLSWTGESGIQGDWEQLTQPQGNIRVNCLSENVDAVFLEFVKGQLSTVRHRWGLLDD